MQNGLRSVMPHDVASNGAKGEGACMREYDDAYFESITICNDMMFRDVFGKDIALAQRLLKTVLERPVGEVELLHHAHEMRSDAGARASWFDVYLRTADGAVGNVEMQCYKDYNLPLRVRAHLSAVDRDAWHRGQNYGDLASVAVVFLCTYDPFGDDQRKYTFRRCSAEPESCLLDRQEVVILNTKGTRGEVSEGLALFLRYVAGYHTDEVLADPFVHDVDERVRLLRRNAEWREGFMSLQERIDFERREAERIGEKRGRADERIQTLIGIVRHMMASGLGKPQEALANMGVPEQEWPAVLSKL